MQSIAFSVSCAVLLSIGSLAVLPQSASNDDPIAVARAHYAQVERELAAACPSDLSSEQRAERARLLAELRAYRERGDFGRFDGESGERVPQFVDADGRRCAVAQLLHASGEDALVARVRALDNEAWIFDLAGDGEFATWLERSGLSFEEAARIQLPAGGGRPPADVGVDRPPRNDYDGPGDTLPDRPSGSGTPGRVGSGSTGAPSTSGAPAAGPDPASPAAAPSTASIFASDSDWWLWWEFNKLAYLQPNRLRMWDLSATGDGIDNREERLAALRASMLPTLEAALTDTNAVVRSSAAIALGRAAGARAVAPLLPLLADSNELVRQRAILALGATGSAEALPILISIAKRGTLPDTEGVRLSPLARPLAIVALGLGRRAGFDASIDLEVASFLSTRKDSDRERVGLAALIYHTLAPSARIEPLALALALDKSESAPLRCRAIESLRSSKDPKVISHLQDLLGGPSSELRRSAALALGAVEEPLAAPALQTAFELEAEPLARSLALIALGERGGPAARDFLVQVLAQKKSGMRPWCALALGLIARESAEPALLETLRKGAAAERNHDFVGAWWLASGLARDAAAVESLKTALAQEPDPRQRMYAATALALIGNEAARSALLERVASEESPLVRVAIAQALGQIGDLRDAGAMFKVLLSLREPGLEGLCAVALGFHGSSEALRGVAELSASRASSPIARAASIDALGMLLGSSPAFAMSDVSRHSNYAMFSEWVEELFQVTL